MAYTTGSGLTDDPRREDTTDEQIEFWTNEDDRRERTTDEQREFWLDGSEDGADVNYSDEQGEHYWGFDDDTMDAIGITGLDTTDESITDQVVDASWTYADASGTDADEGITPDEFRDAQDENVLADVANEILETTGDAVDDATDLTPGWFDWIMNHQEEVAIGAVVFAFLFLARPYASAADAAS